MLDVNGDSQFTEDDIYLMIDWLIGKKSMPPAGAPAFVAADVNGDGAIDAVDIELMIARYLGKINQFPIEP
jgi:dockerin type I repeat protein